MKTTLAITAILAAFLFGTATAATDKIVCYYGSSAMNRPGLGQFNVEDIDPTLCTHLIYTFVGIGDDGTVKVLDAWKDLEENGGLGAFKRFVKLKERSPGVKTLIAIGGWNEGGATFSKVADSKKLRKQFVANAVKFLRKYKFDGLDLAWEYPANPKRGGRPQDVKNFSKLIKELRAAFNKHGLLLTAAVAAAESAIVNYYEVPELSKYLDFINVMAYDFHGSWENVTGLNAPLYPSTNDSTPALNVKACIEGWIRQGADPKKLVLGMETYGRTFTLSSQYKNGVGAPAVGEGLPGKYTKELGILGYNEIVEKIKARELSTAWKSEQKASYGYFRDQWVGFDNTVSIEYKCAYAKAMGLGGGMIWSIDTDDFLGVSRTKFPLLKAINNAFGRIV